MKDPAVLFYFQDFLVGTQFMTDDEVGKYIKILCHQADKGALTHLQVQRLCGGSIPDAVMEKLSIDLDGNLYQKRMQFEREKRLKYSESRSKNRTSICKTYEQHMENEDENRIIIDYDFIVSNYHSLCPNMAKVIALNDTRKGYINARFSEYGVEKITEVLRRAGQSDFLNGKNDKAWKADFEWLMRPQNFLKVLEGKYENKGAKFMMP